MNKIHKNASNYAYKTRRLGLCLIVFVEVESEESEVGGEFVGE